MHHAVVWFVTLLLLAGTVPHALAGGSVTRTRARIPSYCQVWLPTWRPGTKIPSPKVVGTTGWTVTWQRDGDHTLITIVLGD